MMNEKTFYSILIDTPLGGMQAIADSTALYLLEFADRITLDQQLKRIGFQGASSNVISKANQVLVSISQELKAYFDGKLKTFKTPISYKGTSFEVAVWQALLRVSYGKTMSYAEQATSMGQPKAVRAIANANGRNRLAIIIPCHRIIRSSGEIGGYAGLPARKKWLLSHEKGEGEERRG